MRKTKHCLLPITSLLVCCCICATGCKSMQGGFSKLAFWKKDTPPVSQLAQRNHDLAPPSRSASVLDGTTNRSTETGTLGGSGAGIDRYAQTQAKSGPPTGPSAYGRTKPYSYSPGGSSDSIGPGSLAARSSETAKPPSSIPPSSGFPNDSRFGGKLGEATSGATPGNRTISNNGFGGDRTSSQTFAANSRGTSKPFGADTGTSSAKTGGIQGYQPSIPNSQPKASPRDQFNGGTSFASNTSASTSPSTNKAPTAGQYPSTKFGTYSPSASQAGLNSDPTNSRFSNVSQVSRNEPVSLSNTQASSNASLPTLPAIALNRNGSYAPGSTGSAAGGAYPAGYTPSSGAIARQQAACTDGCSCSSCQTKSTADASATRGGGSFNIR